MKLYTCTHCKNTLYFENSKCLHCQQPVGFDPSGLTMIALQQGAKDPALFSHTSDRKKQYRFCINAHHGVCNWLLPVGSESDFCVACEMNRVIPALDNDLNLVRWKNIEIAKHRLVYSLLRLKLPFRNESTEATEHLQFNFMADRSTGEKIMTGHDNGLITINVAEADEAERAKNKFDLGERYRTLLGHFRHESGHFYWDILVRDKPVLEEFRQLFGNEQKGYAAALAAHYENGAPADWNEHFISPYATMHPWEDWAESWAHYLHMMDTLETSWSSGIRIDPAEIHDTVGSPGAKLKDPYSIKDFSKLINQWYPLCFAVNSLNRSMGHPDFYPFVFSPAAVQKLAFIHKLCQQ